MWWMLAREVLRMRGTISREHPWEVMPDLYFYRDPEEVKACCTKVNGIPWSGSVKLNLPIMVFLKTRLRRKNRLLLRRP